jgi:hypothetical protein
METQDNYKYLNDENKYKIYSDGRVYSCIRNSFMKAYYGKIRKFYTIKLTVNKNLVAYTLHTLIYSLFKGDIEKGQYITFKDGNEHNINIDNLIVISRNTNKNEITFDKNEWKFIPGYENRYIINKNGIVKSLICDKILENNHNKKFDQSYTSVKLVDKDGKRNSYLVHTLVYCTFIGDIQENMVVDHINTNKFDNNVNNLRLITKSENSKNWIRKKYENNKDKLLSKKFINIETKYKNIDLSNYSINKYGQIINNHNKLLKSIDFNLYKIAMLKDKNTKKHYNIRIHQLVATIFLDNPNNYEIVHHKDNYRANNYYKNLEWTTQKQNIMYTQAKKVKQISLDGKLIKIFDCVNDVFRELNKQYGANIRMVCNGKRQTAFGYKWEWVNE